MNEFASIVKYGSGDKTVTIDLTSIPTVSLVALAQKGLNHYLGNEAAARVSNAVDEACGVDYKTEKSAARAAREAWKAANAEVFDKLVLDTQAAFLAAIQAGEIGASSGGRGTALETIMKRIASDEINNIFSTQRIAKPKKVAEKIPFGDGSEFTFGELVERRLSEGHPYSHGPRIRKLAEAEQARLAKAAGAKTGEATPGGLGL
jgi:hypothetical protein